MTGDEAELAGVIAGEWGLRSPSLTTLAGGMNSETWLVTVGEERYVVKRVDSSGEGALITGAEAASTLAARGLLTGRPVPTRRGQLVSLVHRLALLEHVPGYELGGETDEEQVLIARTLAEVHRAAGPERVASMSHFAPDWLSPASQGVADQPWLASAILEVREETDALTLTWSLLHTDPAPEAFIHDNATGRTGLIDWAGACRGPLLYDVASAVMYLGGAEQASTFLATYRESDLVRPDEWPHLRAFSRFREVVQGVYFAGRLATNDLTGGIDEAENRKGLDGARRRLAALEA